MTRRDAACVTLGAAVLLLAACAHPPIRRILFFDGGAALDEQARSVVAQAAREAAERSGEHVAVVRFADAAGPWDALSAERAEVVHVALVAAGVEERRIVLVTRAPRIGIEGRAEAARIVVEIGR